MAMRWRGGRSPWAATRLRRAFVGVALFLLVTGVDTATAATAPRDVVAYIYNTAALEGVSSELEAEPQGSPTGPVPTLRATPLSGGDCTYETACYNYDAPALLSSQSKTASHVQGSPSGLAAASAGSRYRSAGGVVPRGSDIDHVIDLQLGGADDILNMNPLDMSVNRSLGAQIGNQISGLEPGTRICSVSICSR